MPGPDARIADLASSAFRIPTDAPEADGTATWDATTLILVEVSAGGQTGIGYTYSGKSASTLIAETLTDVVTGGDALDIPKQWLAMVGAVRNLGWRGIAPRRSPRWTGRSGT